jgi:hypothetical protein
MEDINRYSFLHRDETVTYEMIKGVIVSGDSKTPDADVTNIHVKSHTRKESQAIANMYKNPSLVRDSHIDNVNGSNPAVNLNEVIIKCSEVRVSKQSQIIVVNNEETQNEFDKDDEGDDSAERNLLRDDFFTVRYSPDGTSSDMGSTIRDNEVSMSDLRATVTTLRSWTSSSERIRHANEEASMSKQEVNTGAPNT